MFWLSNYVCLFLHMCCLNLNPWFRLQLKAEFLFFSSLNSSLTKQKTIVIRTGKTHGAWELSFTLALALLCEFDKHPHQRQHL